MQLRHLKFFATVADMGSFRSAAEKLHISQPPLSRQIMQLETELGARLIDRSKRQIRLTDAGRVFEIEARRILSDVENAKKIAFQIDRGEVGYVSFGSATPPSTGFLFELVKIFGERYPKVRLGFHSLLPSEQIAALREGQIDFAFPTLPMTCDNLKVIPAYHDTLVVAMPADHPLASLLRVPLSAVAQYPYLSQPRDLCPGWCAAIEAIFTRAGLKLQLIREQGDPYTVYPLVSAGLGLTLTTKTHSRVVAVPGIIFRELAPAQTVTRGVVYDPTKKSFIRSKFLDVLMEAVSSFEGSE